MSNSNSEHVDALNSAFTQSGITFLDTSEALAEFAKANPIHYGEDGEPYSHLNGVRTPLHLCLLEFGSENKNLVDGRSLPRAKSKADLKTPQAKTQYIKTHGLDAFEKLPLSYSPPAEVVTQSDWRKLSLSDKVARLKVDPDCQRKLKPDVQHGATFVNEELLEKQKQIRPSGFR